MYTAAHEIQQESINYVVHFINPKRKSDVIARNWHNMHNKSSDPCTLREKLQETFNDQLYLKVKVLALVTMKNEAIQGAGLRAGMT